VGLAAEREKKEGREPQTGGPAGGNICQRAGGKRKDALTTGSQPKQINFRFVLFSFKPNQICIAPKLVFPRSNKLE
jgi:hypothetical protein